MSKCDNCEVKKWYARVVDYHIFGEEDCPYVCDKKGEIVKEEENERQDSKENS